MGSPPPDPGFNGASSVNSADFAPRRWFCTWGWDSCGRRGPSGWGRDWEWRGAGLGAAGRVSLGWLGARGWDGLGARGWVIAGVGGAGLGGRGRRGARGLRAVGLRGQAVAGARRRDRGGSGYAGNGLKPWKSCSADGNPPGSRGREARGACGGCNRDAPEAQPCYQGRSLSVTNARTILLKRNHVSAHTTFGHFRGLHSCSGRVSGGVRSGSPDPAKKVIAFHVIVTSRRRQVSEARKRDPAT